MTSRYPVQIDSALNLPLVVDNFTPVTGSVANRLRDAIINVESELGVKPSGLHGTVRGRLDQIEAIVGSLTSEGGGSGVPGGVATQVQFNDGGVFAGDAGFTYNKTSNTLFVNDAISIGDTATVPQPAPTNGVTLYVDSGFLKYRRSDGHITILNGATGIKIVADLTERNDIAPGDRYEGMLVYVIDDGYGNSYYQLVGGIDNTDWEFAEFVDFRQNLSSASLTTGPVASSSLQTSLITNNGKIIVNGIDTSVLSDGYQGVIYYDLSENKFKVSENGTAYVDLLGGSGTGTPGGSDTQVQFNDSGAFAGDTGFIYNKTTNLLSLSDAIAFGAAPATTGNIRLSAAGTIYGVAPGSGDARLLRFNESNDYVLRVGEGSTVGTIVLETTSAPGGGLSVQGTGSERMFIGKSSSDHIDLGGTPASTGMIRMTNSTAIKMRNVGNSADIHVIGNSGSNNDLNIGDSNCGTVKILPSTEVWLGSSTGTSLIATSTDVTMWQAVLKMSSGNVATTGNIRLANAQKITARNALNSANITIAELHSNDSIIIGENNAGGEQAVATIVNGSSYVALTANTATRLLATPTGLQIGAGSADHGGGSGVVGIDNAATNPTTNPTNGIVVYVDASDGYLKYRKADGNVITINGATGGGGIGGVGALGQAFYTNVGTSALWGGNATTTSNTFSTLLQLTDVDVAEDGYIDMYVSVSGRITQDTNTSVSAYGEFKLQINGVDVPGGATLFQGIPNAALFEPNLGCASLVRRAAVTAGTHTVSLMWKCAGPSGRSLDILESTFPTSDHGTLLVVVEGDSSGGGGGSIPLAIDGDMNITSVGLGTDPVIGGASTEKNVGIGDSITFEDTISLAAVVGGYNNQIGVWPVNPVYNGDQSFIGGGSDNKIYGYNSALVGAEQAEVSGLALWSLGQGFRAKVDFANTHTIATAAPIGYGITRSQRNSWLMYGRITSVQTQGWPNDSNGNQFNFYTAGIEDTFMSVRMELIAVLYPTTSANTGHWRKVTWDLLIHVDDSGNGLTNPTILAGSTPVVDQSDGDGASWNVQLFAESGILYPRVQTGGGYDVLLLCKVDYMEISKPT